MTCLPNKKRSGPVAKHPEDTSGKDKVSRQSILNLLAKAWYHAGPPGVMDLSDIAGQLNISVEDVRPAIEPLFVMGAVDTDRVGIAAYLTPKGYAQLRNPQPQSDHYDNATG
jgi:hypothetical protein